MADKKRIVIGEGMGGGIAALQKIGALPGQMISVEPFLGKKFSGVTREETAKMLAAAFEVKVDPAEVPKIVKWLFDVKDWTKVNTKVKGWSDAQKAIAERIQAIPVQGAGDLVQKALVTAIPEAVKANLGASSAKASHVTPELQRLIQDYALLPVHQTSSQKSLNKAVGGADGGKTVEVGDLKSAGTVQPETAAMANEMGVTAAQTPDAPAPTATTATAPTATAGSVSWKQAFRPEQIRQMDKLNIPEHMRQDMADQAGADAVAKFPDLLREAKATLQAGRASGKNPTAGWSKSTLHSMGAATGAFPKNPDEAIFELMQKLQAEGDIAPDKVKALTSRLREAANTGGTGAEHGPLFDEIGAFIKDATAKRGEAGKREALNAEAEAFGGEFAHTVKQSRGVPEDREVLLKLQENMKRLQKTHPDVAKQVAPHMSEFAEKLKLAELEPGLISTFKRTVARMGGGGKAAAKIGGGAAAALGVSLLTKLITDQLGSQKAERTGELLRASAKTAPEMLQDIRFQEAQQRAAVGQAGMPSPQAVMMAQMLANPPAPSFRTNIGPAPEEKIQGKSPDEVLALLAAMGGR